MGLLLYRCFKIQYEPVASGFNYFFCRGLQDLDMGRYFFSSWNLCFSFLFLFLLTLPSRTRNETTRTTTHAHTRTHGHVVKGNKTLWGLWWVTQYKRRWGIKKGLFLPYMQLQLCREVLCRRRVCWICTPKILSPRCKSLPIL